MYVKKVRKDYFRAPDYRVTINILFYFQREMLLERGQMRLCQNAASHQQHTEKIMLGRVLGPLSDKHRQACCCMILPYLGFILVRFGPAMWLYTLVCHRFEFFQVI